VRHAKVNVPYYKDRLGEINSIDDLNKLPFLTKENIKENIDQLKAKNFSENRFQKDATSGSTGASLYFFTDAQNYLKKAVNYRGDSWAGAKYGSKSLYLWGAERDISRNKSLKIQLKERFFKRRKILSTYYMSDKDVSTYLNELNDYKPSLLVSYPSPLYRVASFAKEYEIAVFPPKGIVTSAETLFPFQRKLIEEIFGSHIFNRYGSREFGHIASECEFHKGLHLNQDNLIVEIIDSNGKNCSPGEVGEIVITDLYNYVFPFIRYRIGDLGILSNEKCKCGRNLALLESVEGRVFDLIMGLNGNVVGGTYWTLLKYKISGWQKFQIIQETLGDLHIIVENNKEIEDGFKEKLIDIIKEKLGENMSISVVIIDKIPETKTGKHRWIISKISPYVR
jgi:phenylacetate-CoA ligase